VLSTLTASTVDDSSILLCTKNYNKTRYNNGIVKFYKFITAEENTMKDYFILL